MNAFLFIVTHAILVMTIPGDIQNPTVFSIVSFVLLYIRNCNSGDVSDSSSCARIVHAMLTAELKADVGGMLLCLVGQLLL